MPVLKKKGYMKMFMLLLSVCFAASLNADEVAKADEAALTTSVLPVSLTPARVAPGSFMKLRYHFQAEKPLMNNNSVFVHFVDTTGHTVFQDDHIPLVNTASPSWIGDITYERPNVLPESMVEGTYKILVGFYHPIVDAPKSLESVRVQLTPGPGVKYVGDSRCEAGILIVDKNAPRLRADTEKPDSLDLKGFTKTFDEDFNGPLDVSPQGPGTRWIAQAPWTPDFGDAAFADPAAGFPFTIDKGILRIELRADSAFARTDKLKRIWRGGLLASCDAKGIGFSQQYGYFEICAKQPLGGGVWSAF